MAKEKCINGGETDATWSGCRRLYDPPAGVRSYWKRNIRRRSRHRTKGLIEKGRDV